MSEDFDAGPRVTSLYLDKPSEDCEKWSMRLDFMERYPLGEGGGGIPRLPSVVPAWHGLFSAIEKCRADLGFFALESIAIGADLPEPVVRLSGEVGSGRDMDNLIAALESHPTFSMVMPGAFYPSDVGTHKFNGMKVMLAPSIEGPDMLQRFEAVQNSVD
jgi:hypothetical protein